MVERLMAKRSWWSWYREVVVKKEWEPWYERLVANRDCTVAMVERRITGGHTL